jgi:hypothetical protein
MRRHKRNLILLLSVIVIAAIAITSSHTLSQSTQQSRRLRPQKVNPDEWPIVDYNSAEPAGATERAKRQAKAKKYNRRFPSVDPAVTVTEEGYHWPVDFPPLPIIQSSAIVTGRVTAAQAYLSSDRTGVYSEFTIQVNEILKNGNRLPLTNGEPMTVERTGGRVRFPSGQTSFVRVIGQGMPQVGHQYLLFLALNEQGDFNILTGYELNAGQVLPLDSGTPHFEVYQGWDESAFLNKVRSAVTNPSLASQ